MVSFTQQLTDVVLVGAFGVEVNPKIFNLICPNHTCVKQFYCRRSGGVVNPPFGEENDGAFTNVNFNTPFSNQVSNI